MSEVQWYAESAVCNGNANKRAFPSQWPNLELKAGEGHHTGLPGWKLPEKERRRAFVVFRKRHEEQERKEVFNLVSNLCHHIRAGKPTFIHATHQPAPSPGEETELEFAFQVGSLKMINLPPKKYDHQAFTPENPT